MLVPKIIQISSNFRVYDSENELDIKRFELVFEAKKAVSRAYAPYSNFYVGAAIELENGEIIQGNNQENAAYPSGLCAERVAIYYAGSQFPNVKIKAIAITCKSINEVVEQPISPCGSCRQAIAEYESKQGQKIEIIMTGELGKVIIAESIESLLPLMFTIKDLK